MVLMFYAVSYQITNNFT